MRLAYIVLIPTSLALLLIISLSVFYVTWTNDATTTTSTLPPKTSTSTEKPSRCPPGGVWSEWTTTGSCPTTCGGCSMAPRVRQCTKLCGDCPCDGPSVDVGPCGLALCPFPSRVGTCCAPFKKSINYKNRGFFCGSDNVAAPICGIAHQPSHRIV